MSTTTRAYTSLTRESIAKNFDWQLESIRYWVENGCYWLISIPLDCPSDWGFGPPDHNDRENPFAEFPIPTGVSVADLRVAFVEGAVGEALIKVFDAWANGSGDRGAEDALRQALTSLSPAVSCT